MVLVKLATEVDGSLLSATWATEIQESKQKKKNHEKVKEQYLFTGIWNNSSITQMYTFYDPNRILSFLSSYKHL